jgi:signal transduction histidine kinase
MPALAKPVCLQIHIVEVKMYNVEKKDIVFATVPWTDTGLPLMAPAILKSIATKANKTSVTGALSASIAHELNQPLAATSLNIQYLQKKLADGDLSVRLEAALVPPLDSGFLWSMSLPVRLTPLASIALRAVWRSIRRGCSALATCCLYSFLYGRALFTYGIICT